METRLESASHRDVASDVVNVAARLAAQAAAHPDFPAVIVPACKTHGGGAGASLTFRQLDETSDRLARGLRRLGVTPGTRLALLVRPGVEFVALVFALFKAGAVVILIDPGMGRRHLIGCLSAAEPEGFIAIPPVHAVRMILRRRFPRARFHVTVGRRWFWRGPTYHDLLGEAWSGPELHAARRDDPAAIIFTTGSTGPPKGVLYSHGNFAAQVEQLRTVYGLQPGGVDLACFPLFGLFNGALGVTTVIPDMDPTRPARVDPAKIVAAIQQCGVTQSFASPAVWRRVGPYCQRHGARLDSLRRVFSAGAPVPARVLAAMRECIHPAGEMHTPYGATEALPVATIESREVLEQTQAHTVLGGGVCVGRRFPGIEWKVVRITDGPLPTLNDLTELPPGEIGELVVTGPVVTRRYETRREANALAKVADGARVWHRMGDVGYLDAAERFWFCGRMAHRVSAAAETWFTIPCEAPFNEHPAVFRSALVGVGPPGSQRPVIVVEPWPEKFPRTAAAREALLADLRAIAVQYATTRAIREFLIHPSFPVDIRHNAKIFREKLAVWAATKLPPS